MSDSEEIKKLREQYQQRMATQALFDKDNLKPVNVGTRVCLVCKNFSKTMTTCPDCGREMFNFGRNVKNVPKNASKTKWKEFLKAYSGRVYDILGKEYPCEEFVACLRQARSHAAALKERERKKELLDEWVLKLEKDYLSKLRNK